MNGLNQESYLISGRCMIIRVSAVLRTTVWGDIDWFRQPSSDHVRGRVASVRRGRVAKGKSFWRETSFKYLISPQAMVIFSCNPQNGYQNFLCTLFPNFFPAYTPIISSVVVCRFLSYIFHVQMPETSARKLRHKRMENWKQLNQV